MANTFKTVVLLGSLTGLVVLGGEGDGDAESSAGGGMLATILTLLVAPVAAVIIQLTISRCREYRADAAGAHLLGNPLALASTLDKLEWATKRTSPPMDPGLAQLAIVNPVRGWLTRLFRTHPPTADRIARPQARVLASYLRRGSPRTCPPAAAPVEPLRMIVLP